MRLQVNGKWSVHLLLGVKCIFFNQSSVFANAGGVERSENHLT